MTDTEATVPESTAPRTLCSTCRHVRVCKAYQTVVNFTKAFNESHDFVKLANAGLIAVGCDEYKSPISESDFGT